MKGPSLQKTTIVSAALHITFFLLILLVMRQSNHIITPSPYVVSLVDPGGTQSQPSEVRESSDSETLSKETTLSDYKDIKIIKKENKIDQKRLEDRISELASKKKIERIVKLRTIISMKGKGEQNIQKTPAKGVQKGPGEGASQGTLFDSYYAKITSEIRKEWIYPDMGESNIQATIFIKIAKDGTLTVQGVEKSSGNILFDRSTLKAIAKATPVTPPPYEMEIGIRFTP